MKLDGIDQAKNRGRAGQVSTGMGNAGRGRLMDWHPLRFCLVGWGTGEVLEVGDCEEKLERGIGAGF